MVLRISTRARSKNCLYCLELHRTFFFKNWKWAYIFLIGRKHTNQYDKLTRHARMHVMVLPCPNPSNQKNPNVPYWQTCVISEMISCVEFTQRLHAYIYEVIYIFRLQLPVKFVVLLRAACLSPEEGKRKLVHSRFFLPLEPWTNSKTVQCVQYLIRMYLPCLAVNQILLYLLNSDHCALWTPNACIYAQHL